MTPNEKTIHKFYSALSTSDTSTIFRCYHPDVKFRDPIFGLLKGNDVLTMWSMLIEKSKGDLHISLSNVKADEFLGSALWTATYYYSATNRKVVNSISANFHFKDGLIIKHTDDFDIWKWSRQALGLKGSLFGWTGFMQEKIQEKTLLLLNKYKALHRNNNSI
ncbi:nuclear transport factor 2 family protein [Flavobacterium ovatum]|uniref:nuclear transport factor 2 family protein n=1 Tax=Flavobacterium ovatum TaxID=1928857 RepID=UPI00344E8F72